MNKRSSACHLARSASTCSCATVFSSVSAKLVLMSGIIPMWNDLGKRLMTFRIWASMASPYRIAFSNSSNSSLVKSASQHARMVRSQCCMTCLAASHCSILGFAAARWLRSAWCNAESSKFKQILSSTSSCCLVVSNSSYCMGFTVTPLVIRSRCDCAAASRATNVTSSAPACSGSKLFGQMKSMAKHSSLKALMA